MARQVQAGMGTRLQQPANSNKANGGGNIYATVVGTLHVVPLEEGMKDNDNNEDGDGTCADSPNSQQSFLCTVQQTQASQPLPASSYIPQVSQLVLGRIIRITPQNAIVQILVLEGVGAVTQLGVLEGTIRREDVRGRPTTAAQPLASTSVHAIGHAFQPGDIVACRILSVSSDTAGKYYDLSTAEVELGVLRAMCKKCRKEEAPLLPKSWKEMSCSICGHTEQRKVAKPDGNGSGDFALLEEGRL